MAETRKAGERLPSKIEAALPIIVLLGLMLANSRLGWGQDPHMYVLIAACVIGFIGFLCKVPIKEVLAAGYDAMAQSLEHSRPRILRTEIIHSQDLPSYGMSALPDRSICFRFILHHNCYTRYRIPYHRSYYGS